MEFSARLAVTEITGSETFVHLDHHGERWVGLIHGVRNLPIGETLSVYLDGGHGVRERGNPASRGSPGAICVLPAGEESRWFNDARVGVLHVYFDGTDLASLDETDAPAALVPMHYGRDPLLHTLARSLVDDVDWTGDADRLVREQMVTAMLVRVVTERRKQSCGVRDNTSPRRAGALSAARLHRVEDRLRGPEATACTLADLAARLAIELLGTPSDAPRAFHAPVPDSVVRACRYMSTRLDRSTTAADVAGRCARTCGRF